MQDIDISEQDIGGGMGGNNLAMYIVLFHASSAAS